MALVAATGDYVECAVIFVRGERLVVEVVQAATFLFVPAALNGALTGGNVVRIRVILRTEE